MNFGDSIINSTEELDDFAELSADEVNLRTLIHDNSSLNKMELLVKAMQDLKWDHVRFNNAYMSLKEKGELFEGKILDF